MAEAVLFNTAAGMAKSLGSLALQEIALLWGAKDELVKLRNTVSTIQSVLLDAEEQQAKNHAVKDWLGKLKDAMYDADDLIDDFSVEVLRREVITRDKKAKQVRIFFSKSNQLAHGLKMGHRLKAVRVRLDAIAADRIKFHFTDRSVETRFVETREREHTHSYVHEEEVIGREDEKKDVIELLLNFDLKENVSIIPIVGIGGIGKTTLAQYVYGEEEVKRHFDLKMWVCVSEAFDVKTIVEKIIESATKRRPESLEMDSLQHRLRAEVEGKRYLLVLDDVWNENRDRWLSLKKLLVGGMRGSKILITTRSTIVAEITGTVSPYLLRGLSDNNSWSLFEKMAFKDGEGPRNPNLVEIGKEILQKCVQVPLAIRTIGSLLYFKNSEVDWLYFKNNELFKILQQAENDILPILKLSYDHLPYHLKQCFAFCSLFPKDHEIEVVMLIRLWIAHGFVHSSDKNKCLEDVGREHFMHLLWRSFFQDVKRNMYGAIIRCKMHDLNHDLAQLVAGEEYTTGHPEAENIDERTRYVAFDSLDSLWDIPAPLLKANKMRTFLLPCQSWHSSLWNTPVQETLEQDKPVYDTLISSFKCLRVLNLSHSDIQRVPNSIGKLKHLRYLDLSWNDGIKRLPTSITQLWHLQTLRLDFCRGLQELPEDTRNLISLRHLEVYECKSLTHMPSGLGKLTSLQTLSSYVLGKKKGSVTKQKGGLGDLDGLNNLRGRLRIKGLEHLRSSTVEVEAANLKKKQFLETLELEWELEASVDSDMAIVNDELLLENLQPHPNVSGLLIFGYAGMRLSSWVPLLPNLVQITLVNCKWCEHIPPLDHLPFLQSLRLDGLSSLEYISHDYSGYCYSSLERLDLRNLPNLRGWWRAGELVTAEYKQPHHLLLLPSFPCLRQFLISDCPKISTISVMMTTPAPRSKMAPSSSSSFSTLPKLTYLSIMRMEKLESLSGEWLRNLTSLENLSISMCPKLGISLSLLIQYLPAVEFMSISDCKELHVINNEDEDGVHWLRPKRLGCLIIENVPNLVSLPRGLKHATTLYQLDITNCPNLMSLPEWIGNLKSLQTLRIIKCPNLISLPEGMCRLTSLCYLTIVECPHLEERCEYETGEDWPKISHVPYFWNQL
ncbi:putative disease resistance protein RGA3 [Corylus avellana]|uniref:putative disease resistance protein RGA3 n=1 Tax=Corylus avellana TaxID=13451 RepID=UPI00286CDF3A|nr:putative disease resistance protein RGA3 [Corylus avellana]